MPKPPTHTVNALYAVGRYVVNSQRLEHVLKQLALFAPICATPLTLQSKLEKRKTMVDRLTLGGAVKKWIESEFHKTESRQSPLDQQIMIAFGFDLPTAPESFFDQLSGQLQSLAEERNCLIHQDLAHLNFEDRATCEELIIRLDGQNDRILRTTKFLETMHAHMKEFAGLIASNPSLLHPLVNPTLVKEDTE